MFDPPALRCSKQVHREVEIWEDLGLQPWSATYLPAAKAEDGKSIFGMLRVSYKVYGVSGEASCCYCCERGAPV